MSKRAFRRKGGILIDEYELDGQKCTAHIPASMLGESLSADERAKALAKLRNGRGADRLGYAHLALRADASREKLEGLLRALGRGSPDVPMDLVSYVDDPRVRPALVKAARKARAEDLDPALRRLLTCVLAASTP